MNTHPDFEELFQLLGENHVDYMIVGGYAVAFHGYPRFTKDIDIFYDCSLDNINRLRQALIAFGFEESNLPIELFTKQGNVITFGVPPSRVDLLNMIDGVSYADARLNTVPGVYGNTAVQYIGRDALIQNKLSTTRPQDKVDAATLSQDSPGTG